MYVFIRSIYIDVGAKNARGYAHKHTSDLVKPCQLFQLLPSAKGSNKQAAGQDGMEYAPGQDGMESHVAQLKSRRAVAPRPQSHTPAPRHCCYTHMQILSTSPAPCTHSVARTQQHTRANGRGRPAQPGQQLPFCCILSC